MIDPNDFGPVGVTVSPVGAVIWAVPASTAPARPLVFVTVTVTVIGDDVEMCDALLATEVVSVFGSAANVFTADLASVTMFPVGVPDGVRQAPLAHPSAPASASASIPRPGPSGLASWPSTAAWALRRVEEPTLQSVCEFCSSADNGVT